MNETDRKVIAVSDLPEPLGAGLAIARPVEIAREGETARPGGAARLRARTSAMTFARLRTPQEAVDRVRAIRDGGDF